MGRRKLFASLTSTSLKRILFASVHLPFHDSYDLQLTFDEFGLSVTSVGTPGELLATSTGATLWARIETEHTLIYSCPNLIFFFYLHELFPLPTHHCTHAMGHCLIILPPSHRSHQSRRPSPRRKQFQRTTRPKKDNNEDIRLKDSSIFLSKKTQKEKATPISNYHTDSCNDDDR